MYPQGHRSRRIPAGRIHLLSGGELLWRLSGFPEQKTKSGFAFVYEDCFCFFDANIRWKVRYGQIIKAELDLFQPSGLRAVMAGRNALALRMVRNNVAVAFLDSDGVERTVKFQIDGALSIPGEEIKATELLNHILRFKGKFAHPGERPRTGDDPVTKLEKLAELKNKGLITESEYESKRQQILDMM